MPKPKKAPLKPQSTLESQAVARFNQNEAEYGRNPRAFRDAITKVTGGVRGVPTQSTQWNRWSP
jgi:hypothetical protein